MGSQNVEGARDVESSKDLAIRDKPQPRPPGGKSSSQRICMKCNQPLTGQFVRAIGGTYHLECFKCQVHSPTMTCRELALILLTGLRADCCIKVLSGRLGRWQRTVSSVRDRLFSKTRSTLLQLWRCSARLIRYCSGPQIPHRSFHMLGMPHSFWGKRQLLRARWDGILPLSLLYTICSAVQRLSNGHPQAIRRDISEWPKSTLAPRMLHDT